PLLSIFRMRFSPITAIPMTPMSDVACIFLFNLLPKLYFTPARTNRKYGKFQIVGSGDQGRREISHRFAANLLHHLLQLGLQHADGMIAALLPQGRDSVHKRTSHEREFGSAGQ